MKTPLKFGAVIAVHNAENEIQNVLLKTLQTIPADRIIVIDDGSTDGTVEQVSKTGVRLVVNKTNRGKGYSLRIGIDQILQDSPDGLFVLDGDGQHDPGCMPDFVRRMEESDSDLVIGQRSFRFGSMSPDRILSNRITSLFISILCGKWIPDSQCGFRLIRTNTLSELKLESNRYEIESEMVIKAVWTGLSVAFTPIPVIPSSCGSGINRLADTWRFCSTVLKLIKNKKQILGNTRI